MIFGIGTDLVKVERMEQALRRHGERLLKRVLGESEIGEFPRHSAPAAFLAKRFAAKEALSKALRTGVRPPVTLRDIAIHHDELGAPRFEFSPALADYLATRRLHAHLSLTDEAGFALAFVVVETRD